MSIHLLSRGLLKAPAGGGGGGYTQNFVDTQGSSYLTSASLGVADTNKMTLSFWATFNSVSGNTYPYSVSGRSLIGVSSGKLWVLLKANENTIWYNDFSSSAVLTTGVLYHIYISADLGTGTLEIKVNGSDVTMDTDPATLSTLAAEWDFDRTQYLIGEGSGDIDADISDFILDNTIISNATLYNGGTPPDPTSAISTPLVLLGADMTADERGGNTAQGWNDGYNLGSGGSLTVGAGNFVDV